MRKHKKLIIRLSGALLIAAGLAVAVIGTLSGNLLPVYIGVPLGLIPGLFLILFSLRDDAFGGEGEIVFEGEKTQALSKQKSIANSVVFTETTCEFTFVEKPPGFPSKWRRNGKYYYQLALVDEEYTPLVPSDLTVYMKPDEYAVATDLPKTTDYFTAEPSLLQQLAPWAMVGMAGILVFLIIVMGGGGEANA